MSLLVVGSVALDSVETPFGKAEDVLGGSGMFFSASASLLSPVQLVGVYLVFTSLIIPAIATYRYPPKRQLAIAG